VELVEEQKLLLEMALPRNVDHGLDLLDRSKTHRELQQRKDRWQRRSC